MEMIIALGLFTMMLAVILPMLLQARRNMGFAQSNYQDHLLAHNMMLQVTDALRSGASPQAATATAATATAESYANIRGIAFYKIWIFDSAKNEFAFGTVDSADALLAGDGIPLFGNGYAVLVAIFNADSYITGRAIGIANPKENPYESP